MFIVEIFSPFWCKGMTLFMLAMLSVLTLSYFLKDTHKFFIARMLGVSTLIEMVVIFICICYSGLFDIRYALPLHFCDIMAIVGALALITRIRFLFEIMLFAGIVAPTIAVIVPTFPCQPPCYYLFSYYAHHWFIVITPLYLSLILKMNPRPLAWLKVPAVVMAFTPLILLLNYLLSANYMFLATPPFKSAILIPVPWPYYIIFWFLYLLASSGLINIIFVMISQANKTPPD